MFTLFSEYSVRKATTFKSQKKREKQKRPSDPCRTWETGANFPAIRYLYTRRRAPFFLVVVGGAQKEGGEPDLVGSGPYFTSIRRCPDNQTFFRIYTQNDTLNIRSLGSLFAAWLLSFFFCRLICENCTELLETTTVSSVG